MGAVILDYPNQNIRSTIAEAIRLAQNGTLCLENINLYECDLSYMDLSGINLCNAVLSSCNLSNTNLVNADLTNSNLIDADLSYANLSGANLTNTNLCNVNIYGAKIELKWLVKMTKESDIILQEGVVQAAFDILTDTATTDTAAAATAYNTAKSVLVGAVSVSISNAA